MCDMEPHFFFLQCWINKSENPACPPAHRPARTEPSPHPTPPELRCTDQSVAASSIRAPRISPLSPPDTVRPFPARGTCGGVRGRIRRAPSVLNITMQRRAPQFHGLIGMRRQHPALRQSLAASGDAAQHMLSASTRPSRHSPVPGKGRRAAMAVSLFRDVLS